MKKLQLAVVLSGGLVGLAGLLIACSSDDTNLGAGPGEDGGTIDQSAPDTGNGGDAGTDAPAFPDAGLTLENYSSKLATTLCRALARCCFGSADLDGGAAVDGGTYDQSACVAFYTSVGFEGSAGEFPANSTNLVLDNAKGDECIAKLDTLTCDTPGAMYTAVAQACFGAIVGKQDVGQACTRSVECKPGNFCRRGDGGAAGTCEALRAVDQPCGDWLPTDDVDVAAELAGEACSYRGKGVDTGRYCDFYDFDTGDFRPQSEWKCTLAGGVGANCVSTPWCKDALCDDIDTATCTTPKQFFAPSVAGAQFGCGKFVKP